MKTLSKLVRNAFLERFDLQRLERRVRRRQQQCAGVELPVVSLTSVPQRIGRIKPTLVSLLRQTLPPKEIHINLGRDLFRGQPLPAVLDGLELVRVHWVDRDVGPATKYIPTLERYARTDQLIVVVDDDMYYSDRLLADLARAERDAGGEKVYCVNGFKVPADLQSASRPSDRALSAGTKRVAIVEGCGGYTLRPRMVDPAALRDVANAPARVLFDDDIWLSGHLSRAGIEKLQVATGRRRALVNALEPAITGDRARLQTDVMTHFRADWTPDEIEPA
ncbi:MAG: hypothetical protein JSR59_07810 [Proteobacteria bacterium]|nr:hypothetical protein [Pseudomonadota bacterium]